MPLGLFPHASASWLAVTMPSITEDRAWRRLDPCQLKMFLHAQILSAARPGYGVVQVKMTQTESAGHSLCRWNSWVLTC